MSKYKTPIRIQLDTTKKVNEKTTKYRLPFQKEEPLRSSLQKLDNRSLIVSQQIEPDIVSEKQAILEKQSQKSEPQTSNLQAQTVIQKQEEKSAINELQTESIIVTPTIEKQQHQTQTIQHIQIPQVKQVQKLNQTQVETIENKEDTQNKEEPQAKRVESKLTIDRSHQFKLEPIQQVKSNSFYRRSQRSFGEKRGKHHSSSHRYADEEHLADASRQSDIDGSTFLVANPRAMPSLSQKPKETKPLHKSMRKVEKQVWQILSECTQKQQMDQAYKNQKKLKFKRSKSKLRESSNLKSKSKIILQKLKETTEQKNEEQITNTNYDMYDELPPINQDTQMISQITKEEHVSIIQRLHTLLELKQTSKKHKVMLPLQKFRKQYELIKKINPFFKKLNQFAGCVLLSIGKIKFIDVGDLIYAEGQPISHLSIILLGKVLLTKAFSQYKNYGLPGQSLGQEALFDQSKPYHLRLSNSSKSIFYRAQARAHTKVCILRISLRKFYKMSMQLNSIGEKRLFNLIDNLFKINYLKKNALLHQQIKQRLQTEILVTRRKKKGSLYFH